MRKDPGLGYVCSTGVSRLDMVGMQDYGEIEIAVDVNRVGEGCDDR